MRQDDLGKRVPGGLRAGVQAPAARGNHQRLQKHAVVDQRAPAQDAVDGEHQAHRRVKKTVIALVLRVHFVFVALANAQEPVQAPTVFPTPVDIRAGPFGRVIVVFLGKGFRKLRVGPHGVVRGADLAHQAVTGRALQHVNLPRLGVGARSGPGGDVQHLGDGLTQHRLLREGAGGHAGGDGHVNNFGNGGLIQRGI